MPPLPLEKQHVIKVKQFYPIIVLFLCGQPYFLVGDAYQQPNPKPINKGMRVVSNKTLNRNN